MIRQSSDYFNCLIEHLWSDPEMRGAPTLPVQRDWAFFTQCHYGMLRVEF